MNIRTIALLILLWIAWAVIRKQVEIYRQKTAPKSHGSKGRTTAMVRCRHCNVHLPQNEALEADGEWFCDRQHQQAWLGKS